MPHKNNYFYPEYTCQRSLVGAVSTKQMESELKRFGFSPFPSPWWWVFSDDLWDWRLLCGFMVFLHGRHYNNRNLTSSLSSHLVLSLWSETVFGRLSHLSRESVLSSGAPHFTEKALLVCSSGSMAWSWSSALQCPQGHDCSLAWLWRASWPFSL